jgi:hypothetical protein
MLARGPINCFVCIPLSLLCFSPLSFFLITGLARSSVMGQVKGKKGKVPVLN